MAKNITIHKNIKSADIPYCMVDNEELNNAMISLTGAGFKLYIYLCRNQDSATWLLREKHVLDFTGLSRSAYYRAMNELKEQGYIIESEDKIDFYETSQEEL